MHEFKAELKIIDINPFVYVPDAILSDLFTQAGKTKGPIPIRGELNGKPYQQTLVKFCGEWRLYVNTNMLADSPQRIGEEVTITVEYDPADRTIEPHPKLVQALQENPEAQQVFDSLPPSRQKEIVRYFSFLKTEESETKMSSGPSAFCWGKRDLLGEISPERYGRFLPPTHKPTLYPLADF